MQQLVNAVWKDVENIRNENPLVHNITNYVVMNVTANALLAIGASPVMAHAPEEAAEMVRLAKALVINIGTLSEAWVASMKLAMVAADRLGVPIVFDPVGAGATSYRTRVASELLETAPVRLIRANASEILALAGTVGRTKGVDSLADSADAIEAARKLCSRFGCTVCVSGAIDWIVAHDREAKIFNGHALMSRVTGMGCSASALCAAFVAVNPDAASAATHAMAVMGIAGEIAAGQALGPGSFVPHFLDALYGMQQETIACRIRAEEKRN